MALQDASEKILERIDRGKELLETQVSYEPGFIRLENQTKKWTNYNKTLFHFLFEKSPLPSSHGKSDINITNPVDIWNQKIIKHKQEILYWINDLESIWEQLEFYEELPNNTQQTVNNQTKYFIGHGGSEADNTTGREILTEGYPIMRIDITGYVTATHGDKKFTIKVTSDNVPDLLRSNLQISKEVEIVIPSELYPFKNKFIELSGGDDPRREKINKCLSLGDALRKGDQIECSVFIVDPETRDIDRNPNNIETYAKFDLWLYPNKDYFRRAESDSRESLKFRQLGLYEESPNNTQQPTNQDTVNNENKKIFIGHGHSSIWRELKDFLENKLGLPCEEFNSISTAGRSTKERLAEMLDVCCMAFLIMTGEDEQPDGKLRARSNVIHEVGLFQGKLGFERAIILLEEGCEDFSNIHGITHIPFPKRNMRAAFEDIRDVLKRESIIKGEPV